MNNAVKKATKASNYPSAVALNREIKPSQPKDERVNPAINYIYQLKVKRANVIAKLKELDAELEKIREALG